MAKKPEKSKRTISVCDGSFCSRKKSSKIRKRLKKLVKKQDLQAKIKVKKCGCLGECGKGPVIEISPGGKHIKRATPKRAKKILAKITGDKG